MLYCPKIQKYALNSQLQALQILTNDDEVENLSFFSFLLAVDHIKRRYVDAGEYLDYHYFRIFWYGKISLK